MLQKVGCIGQTTLFTVEATILMKWHGIKDNSLDRRYEPVGQKKPNQLGIHDMSGNIWEWCQDYFNEDTNKIPKDGSPNFEKSAERVLRGGCFHNWAVHCTTIKRYQIMPRIHKTHVLAFVWYCPCSIMSVAFDHHKKPKP